MPRTQSLPACLLPCLTACTNKRALLHPRQTPCSLGDEVQSIDRAAHRTTTTKAPTPHTPLYIPPPPRRRRNRHLLPARIHRPPPPPALTHRAVFWKPFVCPPSIHPSSNSGLPTRPSTSRGSTSPLGARHPPTRKAKVRRPASNPRCSSSTLRRQEEPWEQRERAHFLYHRRTLFHLASLSPTPLSPPANTAPPTLLSASPSTLASAPSRLQCHLLTSPVLLRSVLCESFPRFGHK